jgi:uncharacterized protein (UPF0332 family)
LKAEAAALARHRLTRASAALEEADLLFARAAWNGAISRYYYAAFHAARALLATRELDSARHAGVIALFQREFVRTGIVAADIARALPRSFEKRLSSDYGDFIQPNAEEAQQVRTEVHSFVDLCASVVERVLSEQEGHRSGS